MWETMGPLASLVVLLVEAIKGTGNFIRSGRRKAIQRKIIEIKLSLDDIIENGSAIISTIEMYSIEPGQIGQNQIDGLQKLLYRQWSLINQFLTQLNDDTVYEIVDLISSQSLRRRIIDLIAMKGSIIHNILHRLRRWNKVQSTGKKMVVSILSDLPIWNHEKFLAEGSSYADSLIRTSKEIEVEISEYLAEQKQNLGDLKRCSKIVSDFIRGSIRLEDYI